MIRTLVACVVAAGLSAPVFAQAANSKGVSVGVAWYGKSSMALAVLGGARDRLAEIAPEVNLEIRGELADEAELDRVVTEFEKNGVSGLIVLRSGGAAYLGRNPPEVPTFIGGNNHPVLLGAVGDMDRPDGNVTGVTYYVDPAWPVERFMALDEQIRSFVLVSQTNYVSSAIDWEGTEAACDHFGLRCTQVFAEGEEEVVGQVKRHAGSYDAVILGNQAAVFDHAAAAVDAAGDTPVFSYAAKGVQQGALAGLVTDDRKLGAMLADSLVDVLVGGKPVSAVGFKTDPDPRLRVNFATASRLRVSFELFE